MLENLKEGERKSLLERGVKPWWVEDDEVIIDEVIMLIYSHRLNNVKEINKVIFIEAFLNK